MSTNPEPRPVEAVGGAPRPRRLFRREHASGDSGQRAALEALQAELVLLREENARLKAAEHQQPGMSSLLRHVGSIAAPAAARDDIGDEAAHLLAETLVMRQSLLTACRQITESLRAVESQLEALKPDAP